MRARIALLAVTMLGLVAPTIIAAGPHTVASARRGVGAASQAAPRAARVGCAQPPSLRLVRFEDGSAQLRCGRRILIRVSAPG